MCVRRLTGEVLFNRVSIKSLNNGFEQPLDADIVHVKECPLWDFVLVEVATEPHDERVGRRCGRRNHKMNTRRMITTSAEEHKY